MKSSQLIGGIIIGLVFGGIGGYIVTPRQDLTPLYNQISELESQIIDLQSDISTLQGQVDDYRIEVSELNLQISELKYTLTQKESLLTVKEQEIITKNERINELENELYELEEEYDQIPSTSDLTLISVSFSRLEDTASELEFWINKSNTSIRIMVMLITHDGLSNALISAHNRGVDVDIIIDSDWVSSSGSDYDDLQSAGIDIREDDRSGLMHHKVMIIDGYIIITGSYNWSASAEDTNDENVLILKSETVSQLYLSEFNRIWNQTSAPVFNTKYYLLVEVTGSGTTSPSPGINIYDQGILVQVTGTSATGWNLDHWLLNGINVGSTNPYSITMNKDHNLTAVFTEEEQSPQSEGTVVINEIEANPPGNDNYGSVYEWVELYNPSGYSVNIGGWTLSTTAGVTVTLSIPQGTILNPSQFIIVERGTQWLDNEGEQVILKDSQGSIKDSSPVFSDTSNDSSSWQRYPNGRDTDSSNDWIYKSSTKRSSND